MTDTTMQSAAEYVGRLVTRAVLTADDELRLAFADGSAVRLFDGGQQCCERRYITCDDNPADLVDGRLLKIEARDAPSDPSDPSDKCCETMFVEVVTDKGAITLCTHNEHNGYYGGFDLVLKKVEKCE